MSFSIFKAHKNADITDSDAQVIGPVFQRINDECGGSYTIDDVVDRLEGEDESVEPLRPYYSWDPAVHRAEYLKSRTRHLQRSLYIEVIDPDRPNEPVEIRGFAPMEEEERKFGGGKRYTSSADMLKSRKLTAREDFIASQLARISAQLERWDRILKAWSELTGLRKSIRALKQEIDDAA